jgi:branched-chain amino acid transport system permease protein
VIQYLRPYSRAVAIIFGLVLLAWLVPWIVTGQNLDTLDLFLLAVPGAVALNLVMGIAGQATIGSAAFMAVGALIATVLDLRWHWPFVAIIVCAAIVTGLVGVVAALPALRLAGIYLVMSTLALFYLVAYVTQAYEADNVSGGFGAFSFSPPSIFGFSITNDAQWFSILLAYAALILAVVIRSARGKYGRAWRAIRDREIAAKTLGIDVKRMKFAAFFLSSAIIGVQGVLYVYFLRALDFSSTFTLDLSISYVAMIVIGGWGLIWGSVLGAAFVTGLPYLVQDLGLNLPTWVPGQSTIQLDLPEIEAGLYGVAIIVFVLLAPKGLAWLLPRAGNVVARHAMGLFRAAGRRRAPAGAEIERGSRWDPEEIGGGLDSNEPLWADRPASRSRAEVVQHPPSEPNVSDAVPLLSVQGLRVVYGGLSVAVADVSLEVPASSVVAVLGPNGAGKTTTVRAITGFLRTEGVQTSGKVWFGGKDVLGWAPDLAARSGIVLVPERDKVFTTLTVEENLLATGRVRGSNRSRAEMLDQSYDLFPSLGARRSIRAGFLSGGERQMLALARALALDARLLVIDEMSLGVSPVVVLRLLEMVRRIVTDHGASVLLVEQNAVAALDVADLVYILDRGRTGGYGTAEQMKESDLVRKSYLGV